MPAPKTIPSDQRLVLRDATTKLSQALDCLQEADLRSLPEKARAEVRGAREDVQYHLRNLARVSA